MTDIRQRLEEVVREELVRNRIGIGSDLHKAMKAAIVAGLQVLAEEFGTEAPDAAPARTLPTEPGAVVLATLVSDLGGNRYELTKPVPMHRADLGWGAPGPVNGSGPWTFDDEHILAWVPALVVRDDEHGPSAALRGIRDLLTEQPNGWATAVGDALERALEALRVLDGGEPS